MTAPAWPEMEGLFHEVLAQPSATRASFLAERCAGRPELQAQIEAMLRAHDEAGSALNTSRVAAHGPLPPGARVGAYEILGPLGAGGMGEVYRARDSRLRRDVAIKVLPAAFTSDAGRLARLEREARVLAALNHPNIAAIYGLEEGEVVVSGFSRTIRALVLELVEGQTLAERIARGPVPIAEALGIATQIAQALEAAHEKGIVHRDLKPANIKITPGGVVKVLDFGLAKAVAIEGAASDVSQVPTVTDVRTQVGLIAGTPAYMSPEQARGLVVDKRTDIWAFGCVLYEMVTGRPAFPGPTISDTIAAVLDREPDLSALPAATPPAVRMLLRRCLQKDAGRRVHDIADARIELEELLHHAEPVVEPGPVPARRERTHPLGRQLVVGSGILLIGVTIAAVVIWTRGPGTAPPPLPVTRTTITLPAGDRLVTDGPNVALSPDGSQVAYFAVRAGTASQLFLRAMDSLQPRPIPGTEQGFHPFFSPDSHWIGFFADGSLKKVSVNGGMPITLASIDGMPHGASWGSRGTIVVGAGVLQEVSEEGGALRPLTRLEAGEARHAWPEFLPGGEAVLFGGGTVGDPRIAVLSIASGERHTLMLTGTIPRYASTGHVIYAQGANLMAASFDPETLQVDGAPVPVVQDVLQSVSNLAFFGSSAYAVAAAGSLAYIPGGSEGPQRQLVWVDRSGRMEPLAAPPRAYDWPQLSPDGRMVAVEVGPQIWLYDLTRDALTRFTFEGSTNNAPAWTPDGRRIAFYSNKEGPQNLFWQLADGGGGLERLTTSVGIPTAFSPDGRVLAFHTGRDAWLLRLGDRTAQRLFDTPFTNGGVAFSPDGRWLAYVSNESGGPEIYVQPFPDSGGKWQISTGSGTEPVWNRSGRELFYRSGNRMMAVDVATQPAFSAGRPRMLFEGTYLASQFPQMGTAYDVSPDGQRFLMIREVDNTPSGTHIVVVQNWFEELKRRVPTTAP